MSFSSFPASSWLLAVPAECVLSDSRPVPASHGAQGRGGVHLRLPADVLWEHQWPSRWQAEHHVSTESKETYAILHWVSKIHHIKINHIWTLISYSTPYEAHLRFFCQKGEKWGEIAKINIKKKPKSQKLLTENHHKKPLVQNNSFSFNGGLYNRHTGFCPYRTPFLRGEQFLWLKKKKKITFCNFPAFYSLLTQANIFFWDVLGKEYYSLSVPNYESLYLDLNEFHQSLEKWSILTPDLIKQPQTSLESLLNTDSGSAMNGH